MTGTAGQPAGYAVTVEVFVPARVAERTVDALDQAWRVESWTPAAAAVVAVREALDRAGFGAVVAVRTREVTSGAPAPRG
ncbi:hypothetical protein ACI789_16775 [Geodermatophilus sp. SYSU D00965]